MTQERGQSLRATAYEARRAYDEAQSIYEAAVRAVGDAYYESLEAQAEAEGIRVAAQAVVAATGDAYYWAEDAAHAAETSS